MFGVGATLAGGDAARVVILAGSGSKAGLLTVFFFAIMAAVAQFGILEGTRLAKMPGLQCCWAHQNLSC